MTYEEFKDFILTSSWRVNDTDLIAALDNLIRLAESKLNQDLRVVAGEAGATIYPKTDDVVFPEDCSLPLELYCQMAGQLKQTSISDIFSFRTTRPTAYMPLYAVSNNVMYLTGPRAQVDPDSRPRLSIVYQRKVPSFKEAGHSWVEENHFDLYFHSVMENVFYFLKEEERVSIHAQAYLSRLESTLELDAKYRAHGVSSGTPLPR